MSIIKFEVSVDTANTEHMGATIAFLESLKGDKVAKQAPPANVERVTPVLNVDILDYLEAEKLSFGELKERFPSIKAKGSASFMEKAETAGLVTGRPEPSNGGMEETHTEEVKETNRTPGISVEQIRAVLATKVQEHKAVIRPELTRLGAKSVTELEEKHYEEFLNFLTAL